MTQIVEGREITARLGAVGTESPEAARIGARMLDAGGNAMDAAAAACLATAVELPYFVDFGGYVCAGTVLEGTSGRVWSLDANSVAPRAAHANMFGVIAREPGKVGINEHEYDCSVQDDTNVYGPLSVAVPGFVAGVGRLWERWGRLPWPAIVAGSQELVDRGFPYGDIAPAIERRLPIISRYEATAHLLMPRGIPPRPDDIWHRPDLGRTLARLAAAGWRDFYEGEIGRRIGDYVADAGGVMTRDDMASFEARLGDAVETSYRGASVYGPVLPNGAVSALQILNMLESLDCPALDDPRYWHRLAEILKLAWRDRLRYLADPAFADVPAAMLLDKAYAAGRVETIRQYPDRVDRGGAPQPRASRHGTAHVSAADAGGNVVSITISQGNPFGSCVTVPGTGFILAHGMCRFDPRPGLPNSVAAGKRPLNNVCPLIVRTPERDVAVGMRGGRRIVSVVPQIAHRLVDFRMSPYDAATALRIHTLAEEPIEREASSPFPPEEALLRLGHEVRAVDELGGSAHCAEVARGGAVRAGGSIGAAGV